MKNKYLLIINDPRDPSPGTGDWYGMFECIDDAKEIALKCVTPEEDPLLIYIVDLETQNHVFRMKSRDFVKDHS